MNFEEDIAGATLEVEAGKEFTLTTRLVNAILGYTGEWSVAPNMTLFISNSAADDKGNQKELNKLTSGMDQIMSGEDGKVSVTLYKEGCYVITAYDLADDKMGHLDNDMGMDTAGTYHSTNAGAIIRVKVLHSNDEAAVKASLISELEEKSAEMPEEQFRRFFRMELRQLKKEQLLLEQRKISVRREMLSRKLLKPYNRFRERQRKKMRRTLQQ